MEKIKEEMRKQLESERREKLRREKPLVYEKIMHYSEKEANGEPVPIIVFAYDYGCNMHCTHCVNARFAPKDKCLTIEKLKDLSNQADELGIAQFALTGGEPLTFPELDDIVAAIDPQKFQIAINTNGFLLTKEWARHLKEIGVDKMQISLDSLNEDIYNQTRQKDGAYSKALQAIMDAKEVGLQVSIQTLITHQNCISKDTERMAQFAHEHGMNMDIMNAKAVGRWEGNEEVLLTPEDSEYLVHLRNQYPEVNRDIFPAYGKCGSCNAVNRNIGITKYGDVLPCPYIHISIGNVFEESLKDILSRGMRIKWFHDIHPSCLAGEDFDFIRGYMSKFYGKSLPITWKDAFTEKDFIDGIMA